MCNLEHLSYFARVLWVASPMRLMCLTLLLSVVGDKQLTGTRCQQIWIVTCDQLIYPATSSHLPCYQASTIFLRDLGAPLITLQACWLRWATDINIFCTLVHQKCLVFRKLAFPFGQVKTKMYLPESLFLQKFTYNNNIVIDIVPFQFPYKHAQRRITFHCQRIDVDIHIVNWYIHLWTDVFSVVVWRLPHSQLPEYYLGADSIVLGHRHQTICHRRFSCCFSARRVSSWMLISVSVVGHTLSAIPSGKKVQFHASTCAPETESWIQFSFSF